MCLAVVALDTHPDFSVVVVANRDELHARPALPAAWGTDLPFIGILAGRDLEAGGTWFGVHRDGRWALVTNVRERVASDARARSRGDLVPRVLNMATSPRAAVALASSPGQPYNGFNLLAGDTNEMAWASNRSLESLSFARGTHALSNALLDTPWPKVVRTRDAVEHWATTADPNTDRLFAALADRTPAHDADLSRTGVSVEWERKLSAPFIVDERYGTRCSSVFTIDRRGHARFVERTLAPDGSMTSVVTHEFDLE